MCDSDSSDDDLGLFSFRNKTSIVATPPPERVVLQPDYEVNDRSLFRKRKRLHPPDNNEAEVLVDGIEELDDIGEVNASNDDAITNYKSQMYDVLVERICKIDDIEQMNANGAVRTTKKFQQSAEKRIKLMSNLDGVLNKYRSTIRAGAGAARDVLPDMADNVIDTAQVRAFVLKLKKGNNIHRFKIKMDTPLTFVLQHLAPTYSTTPDHMILQLNDEQVDAVRTPQQLGLTVADIIEVLVTSQPQHPQPPAPIVDAITIRIQSTEHRNNSREYQVIKNKPLTEYLFVACQDFGYDAAKYYFDGEAIDPRRTPNDLEIEDLDCLDIVKQE